MKLTFLGHSAVRLEADGHEVLIDPFLTGNPSATIGPDAVNPSHIVLTHAHSDHLGDTEVIAKRTSATVVAGFEVVEYLGARDVSGHPMNPGGSYDFPFGRVTFTPALHSSSFPDGTYGGVAMGVIIDMAGKRIYHAGDTALFSDMGLIGRKGLDLTLLPIGDNLTMGPEDAVEAAALLSAATVVPVHYDTFDLIRQDPKSFQRAVEAETDSRCVVLEPGSSLEL